MPQIKHAARIEVALDIAFAFIDSVPQALAMPGDLDSKPQLLRVCEWALSFP